MTMTDIIVFSAHYETNRVLFATIQPREHASAQLMMMVLVMTLIWGFEYMMISEAESRILAMKSDRSVTLVRRLLSGMCDCCVLLDSDFCFVEM